MNYKYFKNFTIVIPAFIVLVMSACVKNASSYIDFAASQDFVVLVGASSSASNIQVNTASTDTVFKTLTVDLASANNSSGAVPVTIGANNSLITTFNSANGTNYQPFPANAFKIGTATIAAGEHYATTSVQVYQNKLDPSVSYLLPVSILDAGEKKISSNLNTIYYNVIGNPLAGAYTTVGTRYNYGGSTGFGCGAPIPTGAASTAASPSPKLATPVSAKVVAIDYANLGGSGYQYLISINPSNPNDAIVTSNATLAGALTVNYCIHTYNPATKQFHILSWYNNGTADRVIDEVFTHQ